jgi:hypothetical protein
MPAQPTPEDIVSDLDIAHKAVVNCLTATESFIRTVKLSLTGAPVTERAIVGHMYRLDATLIETASHNIEEHFGSDSVHAAVIGIASSARSAFCQGVGDFRASDRTPAEGWKDLWEVYAQWFGVDLNPRGLAEKEPSIIVDADERGEVFHRVTFEVGEPTRPEHPWHPKAWSAARRRLAELQPLEPDTLRLRMEQEVAAMRSRRVPRIEPLPPESCASPAVRLVSAIDSLLSYVKACSDRYLTAEERNALLELDGTILGLATSAGLPLQSTPEVPGANLNYLGHTGIPYYVARPLAYSLPDAGAGYGMKLFFSGRWESRMRSLRAAAVVVADSEAGQAPDAAVTQVSDAPSTREKDRVQPTTLGFFHELMKGAESDATLRAQLEKDTAEWAYLHGACQELFHHEGFYLWTVERLIGWFHVKLGVPSTAEVKALTLPKAVELLKEYFRNGRAPETQMPTGDDTGQVHRAAEPGVQSVGSAGLQQMESSEVIETENELANAGGSKPRWQLWAIGSEDGAKWHLFRQNKGEWRQQRLVKGIAKGMQANLLKKFVEGGGFLEKTEALKLVHRTWSPGDVDKLMGKIKPEMSRLRTTIRKAIGVTTSQGDPLPFDEIQKGWRAEIQIGYALQEDGEHLGGERRLRFKSHDELTPEERADH